ncbi:trypsin-7-like isoform X1 [Homalodisca vitripennis]|uniref:trypsin-7-like isoform X1 n=1 Tax=Homalodisca vitripennis TaxID=197043 RepID=UPI001EEC4867|nr:trypsin-7-like isoform X1 [Homalodisca vitripennis]
MWRTLVISLLCVFLLVSGLYGSGENSHVQLDIVGGNATSIWLHPYQVSVWSERGYRGSGAFLSQKWIITTASVVAGFEALSLSVRCHSSSAVSGGQKYQVSLMVIHPRFSFNTMLHDVALLLLWRDDILRPIRYVTLARYPLPENTTALLTGWGSTSNRTKMSDILQEVWERTLPLSFCQEVYNQSFRISYSQFCSRAINAYGPCWGDTGDLLMVNNTLYGLLSWNGGCFFKAAPSIFTQISSVRHWIFQVMKNYHPRQNSPNNVTLPTTSD